VPALRIAGSPRKSLASRVGHALGHPRNGQFS